MEKIKLIITGGTIDAEAYRVTPEHTITLQTSIIPQAIEELGLSSQCDISISARKDSKDFTTADMKQLEIEIKNSPYKNFIITHGTDKMAENARMLNFFLQGSNKTVIFTGAMIPIMNEKMGYEKTDGYTNLKFAFSSISSLKSGVYIAFHNHVFDPAYTKKDFTTKKFITTAEKQL